MLPLDSMSNSQDGTKPTRDHPMPADFCGVFHDRLNHLYTLSLLLTADPHKAEECLLAALGDCLQGSFVFREWAHSWAARAVIKNAIRMNAPSPNGTWATAENDAVTEPELELDGPASAIAKLRPCDRFVYVMSVLERYSDRECSILLGCTVEAIVHARAQALKKLARVVPLEDGEGLDLATTV